MAEVAVNVFLLMDNTFEENINGFNLSRNRVVNWRAPTAYVLSQCKHVKAESVRRRRVFLSPGGSLTELLTAVISPMLSIASISLRLRNRKHSSGSGELGSVNTFKEVASLNRINKEESVSLKFGLHRATSKPVKNTSTPP
ncbi:hypothetical protein F2Q69_00048845 [Brassica cretica]|uniref:Uncharacterized protein n=1 Tax=Brassica cretica TaxID=69181 RepID=A0A8S9PR49_BRACR|nr:hypothetical protein F2Q69_00048845 [Brassica cretica]